MANTAQHPYGDPTHAGFWEAARRRELVLQRCGHCDARQFFARPFCLACGRDDLSWAAATGRGAVYSMTTVHRQVSPDIPAPYVNAIVELDEGPRMLTNLIGATCRIGDRVRLVWKERADAPPLPMFERDDPLTSG
jgi:uncharacterized OB-fold protein